MAKQEQFCDLGCAYVWRSVYELRGAEPAAGAAAEGAAQAPGLWPQRLRRRHAPPLFQAAVLVQAAAPRDALPLPPLRQARPQCREL